MTSCDEFLYHFTTSEINDILSLFPGKTSTYPEEEEEQRYRRMTSNRESARRSRQRKKKHLVGVMDQIKQLRADNKDMMKRLTRVLYQSQSLEMENNMLESECIHLHSKLSILCQLLANIQSQ
uniref:bZIP transcription factor 2-like n=1 Tax=Erigeron canadensis TaxID=72917 RepID=UPI001CB8BD03|nr:bZIP transcription factor 2-like [Erigeron canadensis]